MALEPGLLMAVKDGVIELTAVVGSHPTVETDAFQAEVADRVRAHRHLAMTDPDILDDADDMGVATVIESRDPLPDPYRAVLGGLGFEAEATETGGRADRGLFARLGRGRRSQLERWRLPYRRASEVDPALARLEEALIDRARHGREDLEAEVSASRAAARDALEVDVPPTVEGLARLEARLRVDPSARLVLHPAAVAGLAALVTRAVLNAHPGARYLADQDPPVVVPVGDGPPMGTDPEFRVVEWILRGPRALPSRYVAELTRPDPFGGGANR